MKYKLKYIVTILISTMTYSTVYAKVKYVYDDYKYVDVLKKEEKLAKENKLGIWSDYIENDDENESLIDKIIDIIEKIIESICNFIKNLIKD